MTVDLVRARTISMLLGGILLVACGVLMIFIENLDEILWLEIMLGVGLFGTGLFEYLGLRQPLKDERVARIGTLAMTYSWYTVLILVISIALVFGMGGGYKISMPQAIGAILIVMVVSTFGFNWYVGREGDVE
ncbi:MAG: hypothetical protein A4E32_00786 [Methanomassiliicoccales archaeon PtaU1.Bin124]|nr:MAG: hypothetical protein A4E32_00786 [Methanomassiliicoccales archaeon PtaU1.Bin124]